MPHEPAGREIDIMKHPTTRMLYAYWDRLRGTRAAPERGEIEPGEIRHILADTFILELRPDRSAEVRLAGTRVCAFFGRELKGTPFAALWGPEARAEVQRAVELVTDETAGLVSGLRGIQAAGESVDLELVLLPLRHRGRTHARLLGALSPAAVPLWIGLEPLIRLETVSLRVVWPSGIIDEAGFGPPAAAAAGKRGQLVVHRGGLA